MTDKPAIWKRGDKYESIDVSIDPESKEVDIAVTDFCGTWESPSQSARYALTFEDVVSLSDWLNSWIEAARAVASNGEVGND